ncbi:MAG: hypothetical protein NUV34_11790 [Sulfuricaulis sp.]|nr:hypothetical protein [Sulfuricaulis sp.]
MKAKKPVKRVKAESVKSPSKNEWGLTYQQESFAQLVASGRSQADAYRAAYPRSQEWTLDALYAQSSALAADSKVSVRIKTLRAVIAQQAIDDAVVNKSWVLKRLKTVAERCLQSAPVLDKKGYPVLTEVEDGEVVPAFDFNSAGANRALELLGKEQGMFVDRKEIGEPGAFDKLDDDELTRAERETDEAIAVARASAAVDSKAGTQSRAPAPKPAA